MRDLGVIFSIDISEHAFKKGIVFTARVHPGESNASYIIQGLIDFLLGDTKEAKNLRRQFIFKIVPMLNPDGVIYGNYRCSLLGVDLNRRWMNPNKILHPTIYYTKKLIQAFSEEREVIFYCDIHGHSMKKNVFMYACYSKGLEIENRQTNVLIKLIPFLFAEKNKLFSFKDSHFRIEKSKESTARVVLFKEFGILNSYTLEASFLGPLHSAALENKDPAEDESSGDCHMLPYHLEGLGKDLSKLLMIFTSTRYFRKKLREISTILNKSLKFNTLRKISSIATVDLSNSLQIIPGDLSEGPDNSTGFKPGEESIAFRSEDLYEKQSNRNYRQEWDENTQFALSDVMGDIKPELLDTLGIQEEFSDSGGSDSCPSDNDDRKQVYLHKKDEIKLKMKRKKTNKRTAKRSESVTRHNCVKTLVASPSKCNQDMSIGKNDSNIKECKLPNIKESAYRISIHKRGEAYIRNQNLISSKVTSPTKPDSEEVNISRNSITLISAPQASSSSQSPSPVKSLIVPACKQSGYSIKPISIIPFSRETFRSDTVMGHKPRRPRLFYRAITPQIDKKSGMPLSYDVIGSVIFKKDDV